MKVYLQPGASLDTANAQVSAASQFHAAAACRRAFCHRRSSTSARRACRSCSLGFRGEGFREQQLNDLGLNFIRPQLVTVPGAVIPNVYGGKQRSIMLNLDPKLLQAKGLSPVDVLNAVATAERGATGRHSEDRCRMSTTSTSTRRR